MGEIGRVNFVKSKFLSDSAGKQKKLARASAKWKGRIYPSSTLIMIKFNSAPKPEYYGTCSNQQVLQCPQVPSALTSKSLCANANVTLIRIRCTEIIKTWSRNRLLSAINRSDPPRVKMNIDVMK